MDKSKLKEILNDWNFWTKELDVEIKRNEEYFHKMHSFFKSNFIMVITGPRRSGKSVLIRQFAKDLIVNGKDKKEILIINFEDYRIEKLNLKLIEQSYNLFKEEIFIGKKPIVFLDEIHKIEYWEKFVRTLHELKEAKLFISGSTSKIISNKLGSLLTGRHLDIFVLPFSFKEFLSFKNIKIGDELSIISQKKEIKRGLLEYFKFGGFPEVVLSDNKNEILINYFSDILNKDIVEKYKIKEIAKLKSIARFYLSNIGSLVSFNKVGRWLEENVSTVSRFSYYFEEVYLLYFLKRFSFKVKDQEKSQRKVYAFDVGLANALGFKFSTNKGKVYENLVLLNLLNGKNKNLDLEFFYWQDIHQYEVDFLIKEKTKIKQLIQVCYDIEEPKTKEREIRSLLKASKELRCNNLLIITEDYEKEERINNKKIKYIPLWKWLLEN
ncbi:MAG: ATP-binding protein [Nanoarchaeota archaeon]|nr:ATP-binding protein [Nanoarchaeota archaeon]